MEKQVDHDAIFERFLLVACGPALFSAVVSATDVGLFEFLSLHPRSTFKELQEGLRIPSHSLRVLLLALCAIELVVGTDGRYSNSSVAERLLAPDTPDNWKHVLRGWQQLQYPAFPHLTEALRAGTNSGLAVHPGTGDTLYQRLASNPRLEEVFHAAMKALTLHAIHGLLSNRDFETVRHLLDVGGGTGLTARLLTERHPNMKVTVLDFPSVVERVPGVAPHAESSGPHMDRISVRSGDFFKDPFPRDVDAILFSHIFEIFSGDELRVLLSKAFDALPAGGKVFVYSYMANDDERGGVQAARFSLYCAVLASGRGWAHPGSDLTAWMTETGFRDIKVFAGPPDHGLVIGTKK